MKYLPMAVAILLLLLGALSIIVGTIYEHSTLPKHGWIISATGLLILFIALEGKWPFTELTKHQTKVTGFVVGILAATAAYIAAYVAAGNWGVTAIVMIVAIPIGKSTMEWAHEKLFRDGILNNIEVASGKTRNDSPELVRLAKNTALPEASYYATTVSATVTTKLIGMGWTITEAVATAVVLAITFGLIAYSFSSHQREIRRYLRDLKQDPD